MPIALHIMTLFAKEPAYGTEALLAFRIKKKPFAYQLDPGTCTKPSISSLAVRARAVSRIGNRARSVLILYL